MVAGATGGPRAGHDRARRDRIGGADRSQHVRRAAGGAARLSLRARGLRHHAAPARAGAGGGRGRAWPTSLQAIPGLPWPVRFALLAVVWLVLSTSAGAGVALMADLLPSDAFVLGRATLEHRGRLDADRRLRRGRAAADRDRLRSDLFLLAAAASALAALLLRTRLVRPAARASGPVVRRTREVNRRLLGSRVLRPLYLSSWVPNGLIVGCEALFIPFAGEQAGYLLAATAAGMLTGDVVVGRFLAAPRPRPAGEPAAVPARRTVPGVLVPPVDRGRDGRSGWSPRSGTPTASRCRSGWSRTPRTTRLGQMLGLRAAGLRAGQAFGALLGRHRRRPARGRPGGRRRRP